MANPQRRANRTNMFNQLLSVGYDPGTAGSIANTPNWDQTNRRFQAAMANAPGRNTPAAAPTPPPAPEIPKAPVQAKATQASMGQGVRRPKKSSVKTRLSDLRIKRPQVNQALAIGAGGTGLNVGGY